MSGGQDFAGAGSKKGMQVSGAQVSFSLMQDGKELEVKGLTANPIQLTVPVADPNLTPYLTLTLTLPLALALALALIALALTLALTLARTLTPTLALILTLTLPRSPSPTPPIRGASVLVSRTLATR